MGKFPDACVPFSTHQYVFVQFLHSEMSTVLQKHMCFRLRFNIGNGGGGSSVMSCCPM